MSTTSSQSKRRPQSEFRLPPGTLELIAELQTRIANGDLFDNPALTKAADRAFKGTRTQGKYTPRHAYDSLEIAVNGYLLENAQTLMRMDLGKVLSSVLRPLIKRLPTQTDRTLEQSELQQFSTPPTFAYLAARLLNPTLIDIV